MLDKLVSARNICACISLCAYLCMYISLCISAGCTMSLGYTCFLFTHISVCPVLQEASVDTGDIHISMLEVCPSLSLKVISNKLCTHVQHLLV